MAEREPAATKTLSLTFDDGPDARSTTRVLDALGAVGARATFFMVGERVKNEPETAHAVLEAGHEVQLHCERHIRHSELSETEIDRDTTAGLEALATIGVRATLWRSPWGVRTPASERTARAHGLTLVNWTIDTHDWRGDSPASMLSAAQPLLVDRAVVLMHDALGPGALRADCENTLALIKQLVQTARDEGLTPVTLSEMCGATQRAGMIGGLAS
jgi:peptidoglycan-N-acetylglucosamine deacetylase